jgi:hypothetical protein
MRKPAASVANAFTADADFGLTTTAFSGPAVGPIPTVRFTTVTAGLN